MIKNRVFVDMDGVLCDFVGGAMKLHDMKGGSQAWDSWYWYRTTGMTDDVFTEKIHRNGDLFWPGLDEYEWTEELLRGICEVDPDYEFITAPMGSGVNRDICIKGKTEWLEDHGWNLTEHPVHFTDNKVEVLPEQLDPNTRYILIDDRPENIEQWEATGGIGILFPQPWNGLSHTPGENHRSVLHQLKFIVESQEYVESPPSSSCSAPAPAAPIFPDSAEERKKYPVYSGVIKYFPRTIAALSHLSFIGNEQHNPGQPLHWARDKSGDHEDCFLRHLMEKGTIDKDDQPHMVKTVWRAMAACELELEERANAQPDK